MQRLFLGGKPFQVWSLGIYFIFCLTLGLFLISSAVIAEPPQFTLTLDTTSTQIGNPVTLRLNAKNIQNEAIESVDFSPDKLIWEVDQPWKRLAKHKDAPSTSIWTAILKPFKTGTLTIPTVNVTYQSDVATTSATATTLTLIVQSVLAATTHTAITSNTFYEDLLSWREPAPVPKTWRGLWLLLGIIIFLMLLGLGGWYLFHYKKAVAELPQEPQLAPGPWALRELSRRKTPKLCELGPAKVIFSEVSEVVRLYLERRYQVQAIEMTTIECLRALEATGQIGSTQERLLKRFLESCDRVKFTTITPPHEQWLTIWNHAEQIIRETTPESEFALESSTTQLPDSK